MAIANALTFFSIAVIAATIIVGAILIKIFLKDHFKLAIVLSLEVAGMAVLLNAGKSLVFDFALSLFGPRARLLITNPTSWEYLVVVALMTLVTVVALCRVPTKTS
jgi:hypothetical protein